MYWTPRNILRVLAISVVDLAAILSALFALYMLLLVAIFFGNFNLQKPAHLGILLGTCLSIPVGISAPFVFLRTPSIPRLLLVAVAVILAVFTYWLWSIPAARGLIH